MHVLELYRVDLMHVVTWLLQCDVVHLQPLASLPKLPLDTSWTCRFYASPSASSICAVLELLRVCTCLVVGCDTSIEDAGTFGSLFPLSNPAIR